MNEEGCNLNPKLTERDKNTLALNQLLEAEFTDEQRLGMLVGLLELHFQNDYEKICEKLDTFKMIYGNWK